MEGWNFEEKKVSKETVKFAKFEQGNTVIRLLEDRPYSRNTHWIPQAQGGKGIGIDCIGKGCPVCDVIRQERADKKEVLTYRNKPQNSINVLVKKVNGTVVNEVRILEHGNKMFGDLRDAFLQYKEMGLANSITDLDYSINKTGVGLDTRYQVMAMPVGIKPLTDEEKAMEKTPLTELRPELDTAQILMLMNGENLNDIIDMKDASSSIG